MVLGSSFFILRPKHRSQKVSEYLLASVFLLCRKGLIP